jgi:hypothetical protein
MQKIWLIIGVVCLNTAAFAQNALPFDSSKGKVSYIIDIPIQDNLKPENLFEAYQQWFDKEVGLFTRVNNPEYKCYSSQACLESKNEVDRIFANPTPLQSIDPESKRMATRVVVRYTGDEEALLKLMYLEYYLVLTVQEKSIHAEITDIHYNHLHSKKYTLQRIGNWTNTISAESINKIEHLMRQELAELPEFQKLFKFLNEDISLLYAQVSDFATKGAKQPQSVNQ